MNPIEILDEVELECPSWLLEAQGYGIESLKEWQSLREALERQAEELARAEKCWGEDAKKASYLENELFGANAKIGELQIELAQKGARIARLEKALHLLITHGEAGLTDGHDIDFARETPNESPAQSAAALKAEALQEYSDKEARECGRWERGGNSRNADEAMMVASACKREAERMEREAKEVSDG